MTQPASRVLLPQSHNSSDNISGLSSNKDGKKGLKVANTGLPQAPSTPRATNSKTRSNDVLATPAVRRDHGVTGGTTQQPSNEESQGSWRSWTRGEGLQPAELDIANSQEVRRKANVCQLCE